MKTVQLKKGKAKPFWYGHPLIFSGAILEKESYAEINAGELVEVADDRNGHLGFGFYNPYSSYRVRLITKPTENIKSASVLALISLRLEQSIIMRNNLSLPSKSTNAYRLVNSEGDGLSGLIIDVYDKVCLIAPTAYWAMIHQETIVQVCQSVLSNMTIIWRPQRKPLQQDGWKDEISNQEIQTNIIISESEVSYYVDFSQGQKTGFYFDQRENRKWIQQLVEGKKVIDVCCYTGSFSIHAALGNAKSVIGVDSSEWAINCAYQNAKLNKVENRIIFKREDAIQYLKTQPDTNFIILDPPKLAPTVKHVKRALEYYKVLNQLAMQCIIDNGFLLTCTCSSAVKPEIFYNMLQEASMVANRQIKIVAVSRAAYDHPFVPGFLEGDYLHTALLYVTAK